ncbi:cell division control protein 2 homolog [Nilaparvata lugens]|uniref:cell division control protein 2 homolog n=1 Tax=Nilaparvata lugens TaxID=108931 RepID=UPI00193E3951|nr:cell division control protein 2 homolog [Nilaparvata lugens]
MDTPVPLPQSKSTELMAELPTVLEEKYFFGSPLGLGKYGRVMKVGLDKKDYKALDYEYFALKSCRDARFEGTMTSLDYQEIKALRALQNEENIVKIIELVKNKKDEFKGIILEMCKANLARILHNIEIQYDVRHIKCMVKQFMTGVAAIHRRGMMHRDLMPSNILISCDGVIKICDFVTTVVVADHQHDLDPNIGNMWYRSPEVLLGSTKYDEKIDLWSSGLICVEFFTRRGLFKGYTFPIDQMEKISELCGFPSKEIWPGADTLPNYDEFHAKLAHHNENTLEDYLATTTMMPTSTEFIFKLLQLVPKDRMPAEEALQHPFLAAGYAPAESLREILQQFRF